MSLVLPAPETFPAFPYDTPYTIQTDLMRHLYSAIEHQKVAIIESPTGTGKTLSLLTATLAWLDDDKARARKGVIDSIQGVGDPDWVISQTRERLMRELESADRAYQERLADARKRDELLRRMSQARVTKRVRRIATASGNWDVEVESFLPDPSDNEILPITRKPTPSSNDCSRTAQPPRKIYYASRTHSQLSQIIPELKKLRRSTSGSMDASPDSQKKTTRGFKAVFKTEPHLDSRKRPLDDEYNSDSFLQTRAVSLGARKQLCINEEVRRQGGDLDEACREALNGEKGCRCVYLAGALEDDRLHAFRDQILAAPKDIEELVSMGQITKTCPYYATREAVSDAEVITLPYNLLLQKHAREALEISLDGQIVVIDEAHNLVSALLALSTVSLSFSVLDICCCQVQTYLTKFAARLSQTHFLHLQRLLTFLKTFKAFASRWQDTEHKECKTEIMTVQHFLQQLGRKIEDTNVLEIQQYLHSSKIARKVARYAQANNANVPHDDKSPPLYTIEAFISALAQASDDGKIILSLLQNNVDIKYQSLNPSSIFQDVANKAQSIILAGGTMTPMSSFMLQLFPNMDPKKISLFSCGHIIPQSNMLAYVLDRGPQGSVFSFKSSSLQNKTMIIDLGQVIFNYARAVYGGIVVFIPSYAALSHITSIWKEARLLDSIQQRKEIFLEPSSAADAKLVLENYQKAIQMTSGAILLAVIGAKLSEGLNFSDDLARMVMIVGLPFANLHSVELQEHLKHADKYAKTSPQPGHLFGKAALDLYENMCMNSVNQAIGRAIRHRHDWASLVLVDVRYNQDKISEKLSSWISKSLMKSQSFSQSMKLLSQFTKSQL
ncbi:DNA repair helicase [Dentipellis sp. KUC8613]|nr:DNA repair helicase [Dentipellis sp. KUC8613]